MIMEECKVHGLTEFRQRKRGEKVCLQCNRDRVYQWRRDAKTKLVEMFGGKCVLCGYSKCNRSLQFHHLDPNEKEFNISAFSSCMNFSKLVEECKKCVLVCSNCHGEIEEGILEVTGICCSGSASRSDKAEV